MKSEVSLLIANPNFIRFAAARFISNLGNGMGPVALAFGILGLTGRTGSDLSAVLFAQGLPTIALMLAAGVLGDRISRSFLMGGSDIVLAFVVTLIGYLFLTENATTLRLVLLSLIVGTLHAIWWPAAAGILQIVVKKEELQSANSLVMLSSNFGFITGAGAGAYVVAHFGTSTAMFIDALTFFVAGVIVVSMRLPSVSDKEIATQNFRQDFREGFKLAKSLKWFFVIVICFAFINLVFEATYSILGPLSFNETFGDIKSAASRWSLVISAISAGMLFGSYLALKIKLQRPLKITMLFLLSLATFVLALGCSAPMWLILILGVISGIALDIFQIMWNTILSTLVAPEKLSRISSFDSFGSYVLYPLGIAIAGPIADYIGPQSALIAGAGFMYIFILAALLSPSVRNLQGPDTLNPS